VAPGAPIHLLQTWGRGGGVGLLRGGCGSYGGRDTGGRPGVRGGVRPPHVRVAVDGRVGLNVVLRMAGHDHTRHHGARLKSHGHHTHKLLGGPVSMWVGRSDLLMWEEGWMSCLGWLAC